MATPSATPSSPQRVRSQNLVSMVNQVTLEGYLVRAWIHEPYRYLRLANQRPAERGGQTGGRVPVESDYVTVRLDPSVPFDMQHATAGLHLLVRGRMEGRDIPETIGEILAHCKMQIGLPREISSIQVSRPAVQICCTTLEYQNPHLPEAGQAGRHKDRGDRRTQAARLIAEPPAPAATQATSEPLEDGLQPGEDAAVGAVALDTRRAAPGSDMIPETGLNTEPPAAFVKKEAEKPEKKGKARKK